MEQVICQGTIGPKHVYALGHWDLDVARNFLVPEAGVVAQFFGGYHGPNNEVEIGYPYS